MSTRITHRSHTEGDAERRADVHRVAQPAERLGVQAVWAWHDDPRVGRLLHVGGDVRVPALPVAHVQEVPTMMLAVRLPPPAGQAVATSARNLFEHPDLAVGRVPDLLKLGDGPVEVAHREDAHEQPVRHQHAVVRRAAALARVEVCKERRDEVRHAVKDVGPGLAVGEAEEEAAELHPVLAQAAHRERVLEVAEILLPQPRLGGDLDRLPLEGLQDREQRLAHAQVGRVVEAHRPVAHQPPYLAPACRALLEAALCERDLRVRRGRVRGRVDVADRLAVPNENDALRSVPPAPPRQSSV
mmetsp:Transcript_30820/g.98949  ORF Transcript_30820/g.98949 Transcript_30820/m.98949 type:complete len:300 (+) Transcript_30820:63-962(+)